MVYENFSVIENQPEPRIRDFSDYIVKDQSSRVAHHVDTYKVENHGCWNDCIKPIILFFFFLICFPCSCLCMFCYGTSSFNGRSWVMKKLHCCYMYCCCLLDCVTPVSLPELIGRYDEDPPLTANNMLQSIITNKFMIAIMETLNIKIPELFFSFLPSGSLRERFGKTLPSTSILASDYDIMLVPDAIEIGLENVPDKAFTLISTNEFTPGFFWLKLNDNFLRQWESFCLRRFFNNKGCSFLSSSRITQHVRDVIMESNEIKSAAQFYYHERHQDVNVQLEQSGPANTIKVSVLKERKIKCCGLKLNEWKKHRMLFYCDYTLAIHCTFWPDEAKSFFTNERRCFWPSDDVIKKIKSLNCHAVPKSSINSLVKVSLEQSPLTRYGKCPGLEWRYSFSQAEILLSECVPDAARRAYMALKALNKRHLNNMGHDMCSYALKCILFYEIEKQQKFFWDDSDNVVVENFFIELLNNLIKCLKKKTCPNYWITGINLFSELTPYDCERKANLCESILQSPKKYVGDNWLEYTRCIRYNCCYCGDSGLVTTYEPSGEEGNTHVQTPLACCSKNFEYNHRSCPCGPCAYDRLEFEVY